MTVVSDRTLRVLQAIVHDYVAYREPVASKSLVDRYSFGVSAATIRNDMALLEEEGLIVAPHTSSGRVPTDKGYRTFVDHIGEIRPLSFGQRQAIERFLDQSADLDEVLARTARLLSQLTQSVALVQYPSLTSNKIRHIEFVSLPPKRMLIIVISDSGKVEQKIIDVTFDGVLHDTETLREKVNACVSGKSLSLATQQLQLFRAELENSSKTQWRFVIDKVIEQLTSSRNTKIVMAGTSHLVRTEHDFTGSVLPVLDTIEEQVVLLRLFSEMVADQQGIAVSIGRENARTELEEISILTSEYSGQGLEKARIGVLGPTRMDYTNNISAVRAVARYLLKILGET